MHFEYINIGVFSVSSILAKLMTTLLAHMALLSKASIVHAFENHCVSLTTCPGVFADKGHGISNDYPVCDGISVTYVDRSPVRVVLEGLERVR